MFKSARGPGTFILLKVVAGAKLVYGSVRWDRAAGSYGACAPIRTRQAGRGRGRLGFVQSGIYVRVEQDPLTA